MFTECQVIQDFENKVAKYSGAPYAVAVDTGSSALFLSFKYYKVETVIVPKYTFIGVPSMIHHAGGKIQFKDIEWQGEYTLEPYPIVDSCCRFRKNMYQPGTLRCLSFQYWHHLKLGRGGMILTDSIDAVNWLKKARFWGRNEGLIAENQPEFVGWQLFMEPERAARGLTLMQRVPDSFNDMKGEYMDLSTLEVFKNHMA